MIRTELNYLIKETHTVEPNDRLIDCWLNVHGEHSDTHAAQFLRQHSSRSRLVRYDFRSRHGERDFVTSSELVNACADSSASVSPSCTQHAPRSLCTSKVSRQPSNRKGVTTGGEKT